METRENLDGHLGEGTEIKGTLRFEGSVRIDGKFQGTIVSPATLILGPSAVVDAELKVGELAVHGALRGQVQAASKVTIHSSGKVEAEIKTRRFVVEPGAFYRGRCDMEPPAESRPRGDSPSAAAPKADAPDPGRAEQPKTAAARPGSEQEKKS